LGNPRPDAYSGADQYRCLQRIADAAELMAKNHAQLVRERDDYERRLRTIRGEVNRLDRSNAALRGVITRMKRKAAS